jgi:maltodextrin utilization protein YvdJ
MNSLIYDFQVCHIRRGEQTLSANIKPEFSFDYEALAYDGATRQYRQGNEDHELTDEQVQEVEAFIATIESDPVAQTNMESLQYLVETDWYVIRNQETGVIIPNEILTKRQAAREAIQND